MKQPAFLNLLSSVLVGVGFWPASVGDPIVTAVAAELSPPRRVAVIEIGPNASNVAPRHAEVELHDLGWTYDGKLLRRAIEEARCAGPDVIVLDMNASFGDRQWRHAVDMARELSDVQRDVRVVVLVRECVGYVLPVIWPVREWYVQSGGMLIDFISVHYACAAPRGDFESRLAAQNELAVLNPARPAVLIERWGLWEPIEFPTPDGGVFTMRNVKDGFFTDDLVRSGLAIAKVDSRDALINQLCAGTPEYLDFSACRITRNAASHALREQQEFYDSCRRVLRWHAHLRDVESVERVEAVRAEMRREIDVLAGMGNPDVTLQWLCSVITNSDERIPFASFDEVRAMVDRWCDARQAALNAPTAPSPTVPAVQP